MANNRKDERRTTYSQMSRASRISRSRTTGSRLRDRTEARTEARAGSRPSRNGRRPVGAQAAREPRGVIPVARAAFKSLGHKMMRSPLVPIIGGLVLLCILLSVVVWALTNKNAVEVCVNDQAVATVAAGKTITAEWFYDNAIAKLETDLGTKVQLEEKVTINPVHSSKKKLSHPDYAISEVYKKFQAAAYKVEASEIIVNSIPICIVKNAADAEAVQERLLTAYGEPDTVYISKKFVDDVQVSKRFVSADEIIDADKAFAKLNIYQDSEIVYEVKKNDSRWKICNEYGITEAQLLELNPNLPVGDGLRIGQELKLIKPVPLLTVETVVEITYPDVELKPIDTIENTSRPKGWSSVIQQGKDGERLVTAHVTYVNGVETGRAEIPEKTTITVAPVLEIVEVGTQ